MNRATLNENTKSSSHERTNHEGSYGQNEPESLKMGYLQTRTGTYGMSQVEERVKTSLG